MPDLIMPAERAFGWALKPVSSSHFNIQKRPNGQFQVVLNHALLRGVSAEMIRWWFQHFTRMTVTLRDVPGYAGTAVPAYWLWHPVDHLSATLSGSLGRDGAPQPGSKIHIREAMQYDRHGWTYKVDNTLHVFYVGADGWAMGKVVPLLGPVMMLRIHFRDVVHEGQHLGVHYHYEVVIGVSGTGAVARAINARISRAFGTEFFDAWQTHNVIEVGTFENFLPALFAQKDTGAPLEYARDMNPDLPSPAAQTGFDAALFDARVAAYASATDAFATQGYDRASFL